jgi:hypothetical protein
LYTYISDAGDINNKAAAFVASTSRVLLQSEDYIPYEVREKKFFLKKGVQYLTFKMENSLMVNQNEDEVSFFFLHFLSCRNFGM